jgi:NAD(P)-dependent dehydrogenase (short-subunit alcohol dehydrogenase family)
LGYEKANVVVTGSASGMGQEVAKILVDLGADVTALDINETTVPGVTALAMDLLDTASIDAAVEALPDEIESVFSCAGLPGNPFPELDTMLVNFVGARHFIEALISGEKVKEGGSIGVISSAGAVGWQDQLPTLMELLATSTFDEAKDWLVANEPTWGWSGYLWSKYALDAYVGWRGVDFMNDHGIRINALNPGPTDTPMMPAFHNYATKEMVDMAIGPIGRYSTALEQAWPLVMINSPRMSYVSGEVFWADGGYFGALQTGRQKGYDELGQ